jgi:tripartite-type tricarboxylate transporter receptor subunit TctC
VFAEFDTWTGIGATKNTPAEIVERLNKEINGGLVDSKMKARIADLGAVPMPMTPAEFGKFITDETEKWSKVVKSVGIKPQ